MKTITVKRALLSVSDKTGILELAKFLSSLNVEIISTGGTSQLLLDANIPHKQVEEVTEMAEMLDGRVKTLHPKIHGAILGKRDKHEGEREKHHIDWIDLVVVNFYPFETVINENNELSWDKAVEYIDIGGPTLVRAAAKNFAWVGVLTHPDDYEQVLNELNQQSGLSFATRKNLAEKAFARTSHYDAMIHHYFLHKEKKLAASPQDLNLQFTKAFDLRYGENPHQKASAYRFKKNSDGILAAIQHQGKPLSYNNILDAEAALNCVSEFNEPACVIVKHANPCGVAAAVTIERAFEYAYQTDTQSAFGGIVALNRPCTQKMAEAILPIFMEVIIAPSYTPEALALFASKPNLRVLEKAFQQNSQWEMKFISGGLLMQEKDLQLLDLHELNVVTKKLPQPDHMNAMLFAWRVLKHIKSNAILIARDNRTIGIGGGQVSRIDAVHQAISKAGTKIKGAILASDAFFPFHDSIDALGPTGVEAIIQPGGSLRDEEVIAACNKYDIAMVFTGKRCFRH